MKKIILILILLAIAHVFFIRLEFKTFIPTGPCTAMACPPSDICCNACYFKDWEYYSDRKPHFIFPNYLMPYSVFSKLPLPACDREKGGCYKCLYSLKAFGFWLPIVYKKIGSKFFILSWSKIEVK